MMVNISRTTPDPTPLAFFDCTDRSTQGNAFLSSDSSSKMMIIKRCWILLGGYKGTSPNSLQCSIV
jgi:hypothetical protein